MCLDTNVSEHLVENMLHFISIIQEEVEEFNYSLNYRHVVLSSSLIFEGRRNLVVFTLVLSGNFSDEVLLLSISH